MKQESTALQARPEGPGTMSVAGESVAAQRTLNDVLRAPPDKGNDAPASAVHGAVYFDVLPKQQFLREVSREKRRADRSKAPLSLATVHCAPADAAECSDAHAILHRIGQCKRQTDLVGYLEPCRIVVLLPETTAEGAQRFARKLRERTTGLDFAVDTASYPHALFDGLAEEGERPGLATMPAAEAMRSAPAGYPGKRVLDVVGALVAIVLFAPLIALTALGIKATSPGPVIFKQARLGRGGVPFTFYKFRSMVVSGDDRIHRQYVRSLIEGCSDTVNQGSPGTPFYKLKADPRITPVGRFIRKTSIDELPQLFNVLKGEMSLVGPRPPLPYEVEKYQWWHARRVLESTPGITGLWQVEGRSRTTFDEMVRLDLQYIRDCSLTLDLKILLRTVRAVLRCDGAT
jgi:lipopolysaccharide/colanic/teichoic acid biosynthesis glycosyltransferase